MKNQLITLLTLICLVLNTNIVNGQKKPSIKNFNKIIKTDGDTIKSPIIITTISKSNEDQVTYKQKNSTQLIKADEIISYFDGKSAYYSEIIQDSKEKKLVTYIVAGPLYFGRSTSKKGVISFYLKLKSANEIINLEYKKNELTGFLTKYLIDFEKFKNTYDKNIFFDYKSLAEFASAYNAFKNPETYVPLKFRNTESVTFGIYGSYNLSQINFGKGSEKSSISYSIGPKILVKYTRTVSFDILSTLNSSTFKYTNENVNIKTIGIEPTIGISYFINEDLGFKLNVGPCIHYNIGSKVKLIEENQTVLIKGLNTGLSAGVSLILKSKYHFFVNYSKYQFKTENFMGAKSEREGKFDSVRFGFYLKLK